MLDSLMMTYTILLSVLGLCLFYFAVLAVKSVVSAVRRRRWARLPNTCKQCGVPFPAAFCSNECMGAFFGR